ncbi:MobV family relaxase [Sulfurirhabdus autotrophica]|uniref:Plasmid recombination enzyme n=1 Tax=Sulfurirhabdus autotrophica TaxID=1706046 RepID=A0A4R3Y308_9PROT|nr:MobV family relaxase [Sulfurirhabdus autotrophica]TCV85872.1 plasmid recombination enzyme [Sulfurirhabdus autotrophica]
MAASQLLRIGKLKGSGRLLVAAKHNRRTIQAELGADSHIDATRSCLNYSLVGAETPALIASQAKDLMLNAEISKLRKDAVQGIEIIFSLPPAKHQEDTRQFFYDCMTWTCKHFGGVILSFDVHLDEAAPHAHALILPLENGRMIGSDMVGNRKHLRALQDSFYIHVASKHGLRKPNRKLLGFAKTDTEQAILNHLKNDSVMLSACWPLVRDLVHQDPFPFAELLGIKPARKRDNRTFTQIMISKGKGQTL